MTYTDIPTLAEQKCIALALQQRDRIVRRKTARGEDIGQDPYKNAREFPVNSRIQEEFGCQTLPLLDLPGVPQMPRLIRLWVAYGLPNLLAGQRERNRLLCQWVAILYPGQHWDHNEVDADMRRQTARAERGRRQILENFSGHIYFGESDPFLDYWLRAAQRLGAY